MGFYFPVTEKMRVDMRVVMIVGMALCLSLAVDADSGTATYYSPPYVPSACYGNEDNGVMIAAASDALWNNGAACGRMYRVRCTGATNQGVSQPCNGNTVAVKIVDYCPQGCQATIDLSQEAFSSIADLNAGKIQIEYSQFNNECSSLEIL